MKNGVISVGVLQPQSIHHPHKPTKSSLEKGALEGQCRVGQVEVAMAEDNADVAGIPNLHQGLRRQKLEVQGQEWGRA